MIRTSHLSSFVCLAVATILVACGGGTAATDAGPEATTDSGHTTVDSGNPSGTDAGTGNDAGNTNPGDAGCTVPLDAKHTSYIPFTAPPAKPSRLIVMGDSISVGYGATDPSSGQECNSQCPTSYVGLLGANDNTVWPAEANTSLSALYGSPIHVVSVAYPGDTTVDLSTNQLTTLSSMLGGVDGGLPVVTGPSIVVITIGGNDMVGALEQDELSGGATTAEVTGTINTIISNIHTAITYLQNAQEFRDGTSIYLANLYDPSDGTATFPSQCFGLAVTSQPLETGVGQLATRYAQLGQEMGFAVIDDFNHFHGHGMPAATTSDPNYDSCDPVDWFYSDCIHPTNDGHNELRRLFFEAINVGHYTATDI